MKRYWVKVTYANGHTATLSVSNRLGCSVEWCRATAQKHKREFLAMNHPNVAGAKVVETWGSTFARSA